MTLELIGAIFTVGLPTFVLSWFVFQRLFGSGALDRHVTGDEFEENVSRLGKALKKKSDSLIESAWVKYGGGFYGIAALWTLFIVEVIDITRFVLNFPGIAALLEAGVISLVIDFFINQLQNFVTAITWFLYWTEGDPGWMIPVYFGIAYAAYYAGLQFARALSADELKAWIADILEDRK